MPTTVNVVWQFREAAYNNEIGLYRVDDATGRIGNLKPGDVGYAKAALSAERAIVLFKSGAGQGATATAQLAAGQYVGFYLIQNASTATWRGKNPSNALNKGPLAFFSIKAANPDCTDHLKTNWNNGKLVLGWEDLTRGGDRDYDDAVIGAAGFVNPQASFTYQAQASDVDGDKLTYSLLEGSKGAKIDAQTGLLTWEKPNAGTVTFRILVDDGKGGKAEQRFTVTFKKPGDAGKSACISLTSIFHCGDDGDKHDDRILVINQGKDRQCAKVDWDGCAPNLGKTKEDDWVADYFQSQNKTKTLAEITGLKVGKK